MASKKTSKSKQPKKKRSVRSYLSQSDVPSESLDSALQISQAIADHFAYKPTRPLNVAQALNMQPGGAKFRMRTGASIAYGLTDGGYNADKIELTPLGLRVVRPTTEGDDLLAKKEALLMPRVVGDFLSRYDGAALPRADIARNVLIDQGVPSDRADDVMALILSGAESTGMIKEIKGKRYIDLGGIPETSPAEEAAPDEPERTSSASTEPDTTPPSATPELPTEPGFSPNPRAPGSHLRRGLRIDAYRLVERLGSGFSAEVWSATAQRVPPGVDVVKGQKVALKFYHPHAMAIPDQVVRVEREYRIAEALRHPNLIRIYEFMLASPRPHHNFLVMDVAEGPLLSEAIRSGGLEARTALKYICQLFSGLDELHSAGALHRDVKPSNIALTAGTPVRAILLDLGIVSVMHEQGFTAVSRFVGSKHWAPLEQLIGAPLDERSDLYSLGAVAFNAFTGQEPFAGSATEAAVAVQMQQSALQIPHIEGVHSEVLDMLNSCLSHSPATRPQSANECLAVLKKYDITP